jgi:N-acetylmuramoyl-L-alanine amidase
VTNRPRHRAILAALLFILLVVPPARPFSTGARVVGIRYWNSPEYTRVAIDVEGEADFTSSFLPASIDGKLPPRIIVDVKEALIREDILRKPVEVRNGLLKIVRAGRFRPGVVRVVIDLEKTCGYQAFAMVDPYRIIIDVDGRGEGVSCPLPDAVEAPAKEPDPIPGTVPPLPGAAAGPGTIAGPAAEGRTETTEAAPGEPVPSAARAVESRMTPPARLPRIRVMLDPGHGGKDSGAVGLNGLREKDVVLEIGRMVRERLFKDGGFDIRMTRDSDVFIPLEERTAMANKAHADVFVSLHINASPNRKAEGFSTYVLSRAGSDRQALELAARENGVPVQKLTGVKFILDDLSLYGRKKESMKLAKTVNDAIVRNLSGRYGAVHNLGLKQAPFYVLVGARMTAVLVESSFISNAREEKRLQEHAYLETIADSVVEAVKYYGRNGAIATAGL